MLFSSTLVTLLISAVVVEAGHDIHDARSHRKPTLIKRSSKTGKRCKVKEVGNAIVTTSAAPTTTYKPAPTPTTTSTKAAATTPANSGNGGGSVGHSNGIINVISPQCGSSGASTEISKTNGPNGKISWLNCGVASSGWKPPPVQVSDLVTKSLDSALAMPNSPFAACAPYLGLFKQFGNQFGLPPILLASIAMQESSCNKATTGGAGEQGLMQLTKDKCGGAPNNADGCKDPSYNIYTGAKYFSDTLKDNGGNFLKTMGAYNGWFPGMTVGDATKAASTNCCRCQQNLDYLFQITSGWLQGISPYATNMGQYFNLARCAE